jgi:hypothetical protein
MFGATVGIGFIGLLQLIAFIKQAIYMRDSAAEMKKTTAVAIKASDDQIAHSHEIERAYISGGGMRAKEPFDVSANGTVRFRETDQFEFHVNNYGKTPGKVYQLGCGFCEETAIPNGNPAYDTHYVNSWINPGRSGLPLSIVVIPAHLQRPVVFGRVYYETIFGQRFSSGFLYRVPKSSGSESIPPPDPRYTDEREERKEENAPK